MAVTKVNGSGTREDLGSCRRRVGRRNTRCIEIGSADEQKSAKEGTVEAWARSPENPVGSWYGLKKGLRGRFAMYMPPLPNSPRSLTCGHWVS